MKECKMRDYIENADFEETGFSYTLSLISGKYKMIILYCLMEYQPAMVFAPFICPSCTPRIPIV